MTKNIMKFEIGSLIVNEDYISWKWCSIRGKVCTTLTVTQDLWSIGGGIDCNDVTEYTVPAASPTFDTSWYKREATKEFIQESNDNKPCPNILHKARLPPDVQWLHHSADPPSIFYTSSHPPTPQYHPLRWS